MAQLFGMEHNHRYLYGRKVILWTKHKPPGLKTKLPLTAAPKRLQRMLLQAVHESQRPKLVDERDEVFCRFGLIK